MIHHSNPTCDVCGVRHAADHPIECRDALLAEVIELRADCEVLRRELHESEAYASGLASDIAELHGEPGWRPV